MQQAAKLVMVMDRRSKSASFMPAHHRFSLLRPMVLGGNMLFWAAVVVGIKMLVS
ncbi:MULTISPECIES: hypothetical protein [unclassified Caulobacter]|uniref:hypothetical protein n=1 Tax=unclassified Caulobacter TaxID=2648921 RepID=UPI001304A9B3|nr:MULTISPECIES: hypothetical protein [unclassified Caulobacter]